MTFSSSNTSHIPPFFHILLCPTASREFYGIPSASLKLTLLFSLSDQSINPNCSITPRKVKDGEDVSVSVCKQTQTGAIKSVLKEDVSGGVCLINPK